MLLRLQYVQKRKEMLMMNKSGKIIIVASITIIFILIIAAITSDLKYTPNTKSDDVSEKIPTVTSQPQPDNATSVDAKPKAEETSESAEEAPAQTQSELNSTVALSVKDLIVDGDKYDGKKVKLTDKFGVGVHSVQNKYMEIYPVYIKKYSDTYSYPDFDSTYAIGLEYSDSPNYKEYATTSYGVTDVLINVSGVYHNEKINGIPYLSDVNFSISELEINN